MGRRLYQGSYLIQKSPLPLALEMTRNGTLNGTLKASHLYVGEGSSKMLLATDSKPLGNVKGKRRVGIG